MARIMVESTPATRGEVEPDLYEQTLTVEALRKQAAEAGFELVPVEPSEDESDEPAANASTAAWAAYARTRGATDEDLVDGNGVPPLKRAALIEKYAAPAAD